MNTPEPARTEDILRVNTGWDLDAVVNVKQDLPYNLVILGIYGELYQSVT